MEKMAGINHHVVDLKDYKIRNLEVVEKKASFNHQVVDLKTFKIRNLEVVEKKSDQISVCGDLPSSFIKEQPGD
jgi:hypothetical protein